MGVCRKAFVTLVERPNFVARRSAVVIGATRDTVRWRPTLDQVDVQQVTVRVIDPLGGSDEHSFGITVRGIGGPPGGNFGTIEATTTDPPDIVHLDV